MKKLANLAAEMFTEYSYRTRGIHADWGYLSKKRQLEWMEDCGQMLLLCFEAVQKELLNKQPNSRPNASYERGLYAGVDLENRRLQGQLDLLKQDLLNQLEYFERQEVKDDNSKDANGS